jgi:hypothetical protein
MLATVPDALRESVLRAVTFATRLQVRPLVLHLASGYLCIRVPSGRLLAHYFPLDHAQLINSLYCHSHTSCFRFALSRRNLRVGLKWGQGHFH